MSDKPTLGVTFRPQLPPERLREVAQAADRAGVAELWLWEDCFLEGGLTAATAALAWTERLRVGVGLLPVDNLIGRADAVVGSWDMGIRSQPVWTWLSGLRLARFFTSVH